MKCKYCNCEIPMERLEVLPHTTTCVRCSDEEKNLAFMVYPHKTGSDCMIVRSNNKENVRIAKRGNRRAR